MKETAYLSLGSNSGDRAQAIHNALDAVNALPSTAVTRISDVYETTPLDMESPNKFLNAAAEIVTDLEPAALLGELETIEKRLGRREKSTTKYVDRPIDIDILYYGSHTITERRLIIPHPRLHERSFVLIPLNQIAPFHIDPVRRQTPAQMLERLAQGMAGVTHYEV
ncbi:2-amino-4-hydroxy-6-hydroxymethyldihydropteridine diphosphokinase [bacterium]|nr:2-amino-4-hydroxy-6-hydroxymethyldihydropteridine diphosphokinase [bacterium]